MTDNLKVSFGYQHPLKTMWKRGQLPTVKVGIYGDELTRSNISLEHLLPISRGGKTTSANLALASQEKNFERSSYDIFLFTTQEKIQQYLEQFKNIIVIDFNGNKYIEELQKTLEKLKKERL